MKAIKSEYGLLKSEYRLYDLSIKKLMRPFFIQKISFLQKSRNDS